MHCLIRVVVAIMLGMILVSAIGCVDRFNNEETAFSTGDVLTPEMIESIFDEISVEVTEKYPTDTMVDGSIIAFWLPNGSVWHISAKCGTIAKASEDNIRSGRIEDAIKAGKARGCKICTDGFNYTVSETFTEEDVTVESEPTESKYTKTYDTEGNLIVYWVKNGSVWHISSKCPSLSKSADTDIISGTETDAQTAGKKRACKICSANSD